MSWLRRHDPQLVAVRRAVRVTLVACLGFYLCRYVLDAPAMAPYALFGAVAGFSAGLLADTGVFGTLGFTALLLTLAGYWAGRYGETTGRDRAHAPLLSIAVITVLYQVAASSPEAGANGEKPLPRLICPLH